MHFQCVLQHLPHIYLQNAINVWLCKNEKDKPQGALVIMMTTHLDLQLMSEDVPSDKKSSHYPTFTA